MRVTSLKLLSAFLVYLSFFLTITLCTEFLDSNDSIDKKPLYIENASDNNQQINNNPTPISNNTDSSSTTTNENNNNNDQNTSNNAPSLVPESNPNSNIPDNKEPNNQNPNNQSTTPNTPNEEQNGKKDDLDINGKNSDSNDSLIEKVNESAIKNEKLASHDNKDISSQVKTDLIKEESKPKENKLETTEKPASEGEKDSNIVIPIGNGKEEMKNPNNNSDSVSTTKNVETPKEEEKKVALKEEDESNDNGIYTFLAVIFIISVLYMIFLVYTQNKKYDFLNCDLNRELDYELLPEEIQA